MAGDEVWVELAMLPAETAEALSALPNRDLAHEQLAPRSA
jgi:hypothetical protein